MRKLLFVGHMKDALVMEYLDEIERQGQEVLRLRDGQTAPKGSIALFTSSNGEISFPNRHIREASHRIYQCAPAWARTTPFVKGIRRNENGNRGEAIGNLIRKYQRWFPGKSGQKVPWEDGAYVTTYKELLAAWLSVVGESFDEIALPFVIGVHLTPLVGSIGNLLRAAHDSKLDVVFVTCPLYNRPHTDIAEGFVPGKIEKVRKFLIDFVADFEPFVRTVTFIVPAADFLEHQALTYSLHPYLWLSVSDIERWTRKKFAEKTRLWGNTGKRSDSEVAQSLQYNWQLMHREVISPVARSATVPIAALTLTEYYGKDTLDQAWRISQENPTMAEDVYQQQVEKSERYKLLDRVFGSDSGVRRTCGNNAIYIAEALALRNNPRALHVDFEVEEYFWRKLEPLLKNVGCKEPYIGRPHARFCQPWTY